MKTTQILYLIVFVAVILWMATQTPMFRKFTEGYENPNKRSEPIIPKGVPAVTLQTNAQPNPNTPGALPFGPYGQTAAVGSYQYQDPSLLSANLQQMKMLSEDIRSFLVFEGTAAAASSDPTIQLPLTQLRADSRKLDQEISVLKNNPGIDSQLTQQDIADMQEALTFLRKKIRLFQNAGVVTDGTFGTQAKKVEGFVSGGNAMTFSELVTYSNNLDAVLNQMNALKVVFPDEKGLPTLIDIYTSVKNVVNPLLTSIKNGTKKETDIPFTKQDLNADILALFTYTAFAPLPPATNLNMKVSKADLQLYQTNLPPYITAYSQIVTADPTVARHISDLKALQTSVNDLLTRLNNGSLTEASLTMTRKDALYILFGLAYLAEKLKTLQPQTTTGMVVPGATTPSPKTRATKADLQDLQSKIYAAILSLSASGTTDAVTQARIKNLQGLYGNVSDTINKVDSGVITEAEIPIFKEDIALILPNLAKPSEALVDIFNQPSGAPSNPVQTFLAGIVGEQNAESVFKSLVDKGMFRFNVDFGYNVPGSNNQLKSSSQFGVDSKGNLTQTNGKQTIQPANATKAEAPAPGAGGGDAMKTEGPFDTGMSGYEDRLAQSRMMASAGNMDWKVRVKQICEQIRLRGYDPADFGCIPEGSMMSPAYSWRGHAKMVCGRLGATMDPGLPEACGCPPPGWKGWTM
jgi:hypothetical protein